MRCSSEGCLCMRLLVLNVSACCTRPAEPLLMVHTWQDEQGTHLHAAGLLE